MFVIYSDPVPPLPRPLPPVPRRPAFRQVLHGPRTKYVAYSRMPLDMETPVLPDGEVTMVDAMGIFRARFVGSGFISDGRDIWPHGVGDLWTRGGRVSKGTCHGAAVLKCDNFTHHRHDTLPPSVVLRSLR